MYMKVQYLLMNLLYYFGSALINLVPIFVAWDIIKRKYDSRKQRK